MSTANQHPPTNLYLARLCLEARNSLTVISAHASFLVPDTTNRHLVAIINATQHLATFMSTLEEYAQADQGRLSLHPRLCQLSTTLTHLVESIGPSMQAHSLSLHLHFNDYVPPLTVDPTRVYQILMHLLTNAIEFSAPGGHIGIATATTKTHVAITVADTGKGIASHRLPTIFEPFTTLNPDWHPSGITKGLGLALARHLARLHKGELLAHSDGPDLGSTFTLTLPLDHLPLHGDT